MRKNRFSHHGLGKAGAALFGVIVMATVCASPRKKLPILPITWHTDLVFQAIHVSVPIKDQAEWSAALHDSWGNLDTFPMSDGSHVNSCQQLFLANKEGLEVSTKVEDERIEKAEHLQFVSTQASSEKAYVLKSIGCYAAREILHAIKPKASYVTDFKMDATGARDLPAALFLVMSDFETAKVKRADVEGKTLEDIVGPKATFTAEVNPRGDAPMVRVNDGFGGIDNISLLARGDVNHDGLEDLLISISSTVVGGSYTANDLYVVTRLGPHAPMKVLKAYPDIGLGIPTFY